MNYPFALVLSNLLMIRPPPDYRAEQLASILTALDDLGEQGRFDQVILRGEDFQEGFEPSADVCYEMGLAANLANRPSESIGYYDRALALQPSHAAARYDRGELLLSRGDVDGAKADFLVAADQVPGHWVVHYRLAHIAAAELNLVEMEYHLDNAVAHGLDFQVLEADSSWRAWARDPSTSPVLRRIILRYSTEAMWVRMGGEP